MIRKNALAAAALTLILAAGLLLPGCEKKEFDAGSYVQAMMDATYHGDNDKFKEMELGDAREAGKMHEDTVAALTEALSDVLGEKVSDETKQDLGRAVEGLCQQTKYKVGEVLEDNGVYQVEVKVQPIEFSAAFEGEEFGRQAEEAVKAAMKEKTDITPDELNQVLADLLMQELKSLNEDPAYGAEETVDVTVRKNGELYEIPAQDWENLDRTLIR